jgi:LacI family transcriptional regulator
MPSSHANAEPLRRVVFLASTDNEYARGLIRGMGAYCRPHRPWSFHFLPSEARWIDVLQQDRPAGVISSSHDMRVIAGLKDLDVPWVNCSSELGDPDVVTVCVDNMKVGRAAAHFLLQRGHRQLGFCGVQNRTVSRERGSAFVAALEEQGLSCERFDYRGDHASLLGWPRTSPAHQQLTDWLVSLPQPVAIFAAHDPLAFLLCELCRKAHLQVPQQVALLGVDDNEVLCETALPPLSSVASPSEMIGFEAARRLDDLMHGRPVEQVWRKLEPRSVTPRASTDVVATNDALVNAALQFIQHAADRTIGVNDVVAAVPASRRALETRFKEIAGRSILTEIQQAHDFRAGRE